MSRGSRRTGYDPSEFIPYLKRLLAERNESYRQASLGAGLDRSAVWRFMEQGTRPHRDACILLAQHFGVNPNEMLQAAGYEPIPLFDNTLRGQYHAPVVRSYPSGGEKNRPFRVAFPGATVPAPGEVDVYLQLLVQRPFLVEVEVL